MLNYYNVLGVSENATPDEIKRQYRKLALKHHPDSNGGSKESEEKFKTIAEAYDILSNIDKKKRYDFERNYSQGRSNVHPGMNPGGFGGHFSDFFNFDSIREKVHRHARSNGLIEFPINITLEEAFTGCMKTFPSFRGILCKTCNGKKCLDESDKVVCENCKGTGMISGGNIVFTITEPCPECFGKGQTIKNPCKECNGAGLTKEQVENSIHIPKGIVSGLGILMKEGGHQRQDGKYNDSVVRVTVDPHDYFKLNGSTIILNMPVPFHYSIIGGEIDIPTLHGTVKHTIPPKVGFYYQFVMERKGFPIFNTDMYGDQHVACTFECPSEVSEDILQNLKETEVNERTFPEYMGFKNRFKNKS